MRELKVASCTITCALDSGHDCFVIFDWNVWNVGIRFKKQICHNYFFVVWLTRKIVRAQAVISLPQTIQF